MNTERIINSDVELTLLDKATREIIYKIDKNDRRLRLSAYTFMSILLIVGIIGIFSQTHLAQQNKNHIDCIIKDLSTPLPPGDKARVIDYQTRLQADCKIKFN